MHKSPNLSRSHLLKPGLKIVMPNEFCRNLPCNFLVTELLGRGKPRVQVLIKWLRCWDTAVYSFEIKIHLDTIYCSGMDEWSGMCLQILDYLKGQISWWMAAQGLQSRAHTKLHPVLYRALASSVRLEGLHGILAHTQREHWRVVVYRKKKTFFSYNVNKMR